MQVGSVLVGQLDAKSHAWWANGIEVAENKGDDAGKFDMFYRRHHDAVRFRGGRGNVIRMEIIVVAYRRQFLHMKSAVVSI